MNKLYDEWIMVLINEETMWMKMLPSSLSKLKIVPITNVQQIEKFRYYKLLLLKEENINFKTLKIKIYQSAINFLPTNNF